MKKKIIKLLALSAAVSLVTATEAPQSHARGGGGGGRGGGGRGFDRGFDDDMSRFDRGFDGGPRDEAGFRTDDAGRSDDSAFRNSRLPATSESDLRSGADHEYGSFAADKGYGLNSGASAHNGALASDGGFGRVAMAATARNEGIPTTSRLSGADLASRAQAVRDGYTNDNAFGRNWWNSHPGAWYYPGWRDGWAWGGVGWGDLDDWWGVSSEPVEYDYGNNITYQNNEVYYGNQPTMSAANYYSQAENLADTVPVTAPAPTKSTESDWKPLGVYSLTQGTETNTTVMFQLAVNKAGTIRGNYYNALTQETKPVHGAVDKKDMRASWKVGNNSSVVYDTGLANLLKPQSTCLVHLNKTQTQQWNLIKLNQPTAKS
jgi:hypothetical protein